MIKKKKNFVRFIILMITLIVVLITLIIGLHFIMYSITSLCVVFNKPYNGNIYGEMIRQVHLIKCGKKPTYPITKYIYYNKEIVGVVSNKTLILKGTDSLHIAIKCLQAKKINTNNGGISTGAYTIFEAIKPQLQGVEITRITGWSLGAIIGLQVSLWIYQTTGRKTKNIFFGLPPIVDEEYKNTYNKHLYHETIVYNHNNDQVAWPILGKNIINKCIEKIFNSHHIGKVKLDYPYTDYCQKSWYYPPSYHMSYF